MINGDDQDNDKQDKYNQNLELDPYKKTLVLNEKN